MKTVTMNIALSEDLKAYIDRRVHEGAYTSTSEFVRHLIRNDEREAAQEKLRNLLLEGAESPSGPTHEQLITELRRQHG